MLPVLFVFAHISLCVCALCPTHLASKGEFSLRVWKSVPGYVYSSCRDDTGADAKAGLSFESDPFNDTLLRCDLRPFNKEEPNGTQLGMYLFVDGVARSTVYFTYQNDETSEEALQGKMFSSIKRYLDENDFSEPGLEEHLRNILSPRWLPLFVYDSEKPSLKFDSAIQKGIIEFFRIRLQKESEMAAATTGKMAALMEHNKKLAADLEMEKDLRSELEVAEGNSRRDMVFLQEQLTKVEAEKVSLENESRQRRVSQPTPEPKAKPLSGFHVVDDSFAPFGLSGASPRLSSATSSTTAPPSSSPKSSPAKSPKEWSCKVCTFLNPAVETRCTICSAYPA